MGNHSELSNEQVEILWKLFNESLDLILIKDRNGKFVHCNKATADFYNTTPEKMIGKDDSHYTGDHKIVEALTESVREIIKSGKTQVIYEDVKDKNGDLRYFKATKIPFKNNKGEDQVIIIGHDVTKEREKEKEVDFIMGAINFGTWRWNIVENDLVWNDSNYDVFGVDKDDFSGAYEAWEKTLDPNDKENAVQELNDALAGKIDFSTTFGIITGNGEKRYIGGKAEIFRNEKGEPLEMIGINWDRTKEHLAEMKYEQQKKITQHQNRLASIGELAAGVGHEINNPLAIADGMLHRMWMTYQNDRDNVEKIQDMYNKTEVALKRISNIVKGLKTFSRSDDVDFKDFDPILSLNETLDLVKEIYMQENIIIDLENSIDKKISIYGLQSSFQQIFMNLLSNARDALEHSDTKLISIKVSLDSYMLKIVFSDNGPGIKEEILEKIFEPFFTTKGVSEGTGIGLSLVRNFVEDFKGEMRVDSTLGEGTCFEIKIPFKEARSLDKKQINKNEIESKDFFNGKINAIIVDDEEHVLEILQEYVVDMGIKVKKFSSAVDALEYCRSSDEPVDIIISDIKMPEMNGMTFYEKASEENLFKKGFLFITGGVNNINIHQKYDDTENVSILEKPFKYEDLFLNINYFVK